MRRRQKRKNTDAVELNLAAMLDMAFQLLTFFILTFKPAPIEGQLSLRLPPPQPVALARAAQQAGRDEESPVAGLETLVVSVLATPNGFLESMAVGEAAVGNLNALDARLRTVLGAEGMPFEQVVIQVASNLRYQDLMDVVNVCAGQKLPDGSPLTKLSFVELPTETP